MSVMAKGLLRKRPGSFSGAALSVEERRRKSLETMRESAQRLLLVMEAEVLPANSFDPVNLKQSAKMERDFASYFRELERLLPMEALEIIYWTNVEQV